MLSARPTLPDVTGQAPALSRCLDPVDVDGFLAEHWERKPLVVSRAGRASFDDLLSTADVERLVCSSGIRYPAFRLVKEGAQLSPGEYTVDIPWRPASFSGTADVERVLAEFEQGATIVLQALHHHWPPLADFCRALEAELAHPAQANAYFTPRRSQGLAVHHDTHDVFVLQVAGKKRWLVYEPALELPLRDQRYSRELGRPAEAMLDVVLAPGDTLYLPRGWLHEALTSEVDSLHITVGVNVYTWLDAFAAALEECSQDVEFRRSVPPDGEADADLVARLAERLDPAAVAERMRKRFVATRRPLRHGQLTQLRALDELASESLLERRRTVIAELEEDENAVAVSFEGKKVVFPRHAGSAVEFVARAVEPFRPSELPGELDEAGKLVLVRRLVREGFLILLPSR